MPQFTFACFCGLHGLCRRKKKKKKKQEEQRQDYETVVWQSGTESTLGYIWKIPVSPQQTSDIISRDYFNKLLQELYSVKKSETKAKHTYILNHVHELWAVVSTASIKCDSSNSIDDCKSYIQHLHLPLLRHRKQFQIWISYSNWTERTGDMCAH